MEKRANLLSSALALALGTAVVPATAQNQEQYLTGSSDLFNTSFTGGCVPTLRFLNQPAETCGDHNGNARICTPNTPWGGDYGGTAKYFSLHAGSGTQVIDLEVGFNINTWLPGMTNGAVQLQATNNAQIQVYVDGQLCNTCTVTYPTPETNPPCQGNVNAYGRKLRITHDKGNAWATNGIHEWGLRWFYAPGFYLQGAHTDLRFKAVHVGTAFSEVLGYFNAPSLPLYILRDPPGDASYSEISTTNNTCFGQSTSCTTDESSNSWAKARIGVEGSVGLIVTTTFEIYGEFGVDLTASRSETSNREYVTCMETNSTFTTPTSGKPEDVFIGSAIRYAYGMAEIINRPSCGTVTRDAHLAMTPVDVLTSYNYTESYISNTVIPNLNTAISALTPGTADYDNAVEQRDVWIQTLAMNDSIKAAAPADVVRSFNGGGNGQTYALTTTTEETKTIEYSVALEAGLSYEFGVFIGGSGVSGGGRLAMRNEYGSGQSSSNATTNTMAYHLEDDDSDDDFTVDVRKDEVYGTYVFKLDSNGSATSCEYEGGYQLDQPQLWVGGMDQSSMVLNEVPLSTQATFPLYICNNSNQERTYFLKFQASSNTEGGVIQAFGNTINGNDNGVELTVPANGCLNVTNLYLTQPNVGVVDFEDIVVYLYSLCEPGIRSSVTISAYFGVGNGNYGIYCAPTYTTNSTSFGDYIDGVLLGAINNTGTGGTAGASYNDYFSSTNADLSQNGQYMLTATTGSWAPERVAAWIDFDQDELFEANEKVGESNSSASFQPVNFSFTVPAGAVTGPTRMRVRSIDPGNQPGQSLDPCSNYTYGEAEDYKVTINANTPVDCQNTPNGTALPGTACNDGNAGTGADTWTANCICVGLVLDCAGVPGGTTLSGSVCDDGNADTGGDVYDVNCACAGQPYDCQGTVGGAATPGTACDDGNATTGADVYDAGCACAGQLIDCTGQPGGSSLPGAGCADGNPVSTGDVWNNECQCAGTLPSDCEGVPGGTAQPGSPCDDNDGATGNDVYGVNCVCAGQPFDCAGIPGGTTLPGTSCDDGNPDSQDDVFNANCECLGVLANDCLGVPGGTTLPGSPCDDGDPLTGGDAYAANCQCVGDLIDCNGVPGGGSLPGLPCDDGNSGTGNDTYDGDCLCIGQLIDCTGTPGGLNFPGSPCDDGNPNSTDDVYNAECLCAGTLSNDCEGNAGGPAQPGTPCDDGDPNTESDVWSANCECAGILLDCQGVPGGDQLPGVGCNDDNDCTANDVWDANCICSGTGIQLGAISGPDLVYTTLENTWFVNPVPGATGYNWTLPSGWSSDVTNEFVLTATAGLDVGVVQLCVEGSIGNCVLTTDCFDVNVELYTGVPNVTSPNSDWFTVQPNPNNGIFSILPADDGKEPVRLSVHDAVGRIVIAPFTLSLERSFPLDMGNAAPGAYYLLAARGDRQQVVKLVVQR